MKQNAQIGLCLGIAVTILLAADAIAQPPKRGEGGGGETTSTAFSVMELPGVRQASAITEPSGNVVAVLGDSGDSSATVSFVDLLTKTVATMALPTPASGTSEALSINATGVIVGATSSFDPELNLTVTGPARWYPVEATYEVEQLPVLNSATWGKVSGINDQGIMVGHIGNGLPKGNRAVLWNSDGTEVIDLNALLPSDSPWMLEWAHDINSSGVIVGDGLFNGARRSYRLNITTKEISVVPLPLGALATQGCFRINELGETAGVAYGGELPDSGWGFFSDGQSSVYLPASGSGSPVASDLNNFAELTGTQSQDGMYVMTRWEPSPSGFAVFELDDEIPSKPAWNLEFGFGINDAGMISGIGRKVVKGKTTWSAVLVIPNP